MATRLPSKDALGLRMHFTRDRDSIYGGGEPEAKSRVFLDLVRLAQTGSTGEQVAPTSTLDSIECGISANNPRILQLVKFSKKWIVVRSRNGQQFNAGNPYIRVLSPFFPHELFLNWLTS